MLRDGSTELQVDIGSTPQALNSAAKGGVAGLVAGFLQAQLLLEAGQENVCKMLKSPL